MSALPIFPGRRQPSIFGAIELNCRVRNGNGWTLTAISTDYSIPQKSCGLHQQTNEVFVDGNEKATQGVSFHAGVKTRDPQFAFQW